MNKVLYQKVGRRYIPVNDPYCLDGLSEGVWCVYVRPRSQSVKRLIEPDMDSLDAALVEFKDILIEELHKASKLRPIKTQITKKEQKAWDVFRKTIGNDLPTYFAGYSSYQEIVDEAVDEFGKKIKVKQLKRSSQ